jgi:uncharacterized protein YkwD
MRRATLCLLNRERRHYGLRPLHQNRRLAAAARYHTADMLRRRYFAHGSPSGDTVTSRIRRAAYMAPGRQWTVGENLAWGRGTQATPASIMAGWMRSPEHRSNILYRPFREIGIEVAIGLPFVTPDDQSGATFATEFGVLR